MVTEIVTYDGVHKIEASLDKKIADTKSILGEYLRKLDEIRDRAEKTKKIRDIVMKLSGKKMGSTENSGEIEVGGLKIIMDANAFQELTAIESAVRSYQERLMVLQKAREALKPLDQLADTDGLKFMVVETNGVPEQILLNAV